MSDETPLPRENILRKWPILISILGIVLIYLLALRTGAAFVYFGLVSPDTCWLLKLGSIIANAGAIPKSDPFSFTLPLYASMGQQQPYVVYQWLSELAFYHGYRLFGCSGLLVAAALLIAIAYLAIPLRACVKLNAPTTWSFLAVAAASTAANLRSFIRPEIFSCFFLSAWFWLLLPLRAADLTEEEPEDLMISQGSNANRVDWKTVGLSAALMVVWCNMHTGFVSGIIVLAIYALSSWLNDCRKRRRLRGGTKTLLLALVASLLASLINPYGIGLWLYLPHLFFGPVNDEIRELQGLKGIDLAHVLRVPLVCLVALSVGAIALRIAKMGAQSRAWLKSPARLSSLLMVLAALVLCFMKRRLVNLCSIIMLFETAHFIASKHERTSWPPLFWQKKISVLVLELMILVLVPKGVYDIANKHVALCIPEPNVEFQPPLKGMMLFNKIYNGGRIFSSVQIGDMLDLYFSPQNSIFIDTRFDAFGDKIIKDFQTISYAEGNWRELLNQYQIKWIFVEPKVKVGQILEKEPGWKVRYEDTAARILERETGEGRSGAAPLQ